MMMDETTDSKLGDQALAAPEPAGPKPGAPKKLILAVAATLILVGGLVFLFLSPLSPLNRSRVPTGPKLSVGQHPYVYACSLIDEQSVGKTMDVNTDKNKLAIEESYAYAPANTKDKKVELIKLLDLGTTAEKKVSSSCQLKFDRKLVAGQNGQSQTSFIGVTIIADQFAAEDDAKAALKANRPDDAKTLGNLGDKGYFLPPAKQSPTSRTEYVVASIQHKNVVFMVQAPAKSDDADGSAVAGHLATLANDLTAQLDKGKGTKPRNFSGANKLGQHALLDACASVDYTAVAQALGGIDFGMSRVLAQKSLAPEDFGGTRPKTLESSCGLSFRTQEDIAALTKAENNAKSQGPPPPPPGGNEPFDTSSLGDAAVLTLRYEDKFPHLLDIRYFTTANAADAKKLVLALKKDIQNMSGAQYRIEDTTFGDGGIKISTDSRTPAQEQGRQTDAASPYYETRIYATAKGPYIYMVTAFFTRQDKPYPTTRLNLSDEHMQKLSKELETGISRAEKTAK